MDWVAIFRAGWVMALAASCAAAEPGVLFNRDVRPILADHCFRCHGPDAKQRQADLRLDVAGGALAEREGGPVIVAGQPEKSEFWRRITSTDADERMPPPEKGRKLSEREIATLRQWILEGGKFEKHWSLLPVRRPAVPTAERAASPLDAYIQARLAKEGLAPAPHADHFTLLRRATLALTGLPPTLEEIEAFVGNSAPDAYERVVDRLLASPGYGERMASPWLDAARYADTSGYQSDGERFMWRWRDWVIEALNANMPFDQFTIEQLAGDLLPAPTLAQRIATGFNRNHRGNAEGGIVPEEYAVEYVADRVETTTTVWLGLTLGCARCHDHKYDPFTQREFYSLFAFFNNVPEKGRAIKIGNSPPYIEAPTRLEAEQYAGLARRHEQAFYRRNDGYSSDHFAKWLRQAKEAKLGDWYSSEHLAVHLPLNGDLEEQVTHGRGTVDREIRFVDGRLQRAVLFDGKTSVALDKVGDFGFFDKFTLSAWIKPDDGGGTIISRMTDVPEGDGYQLTIVDGKLQLNLAKRWLDDALRVEAVDSLPKGDWHHVAASYDGSRIAEGVAIYVDGESQKLNVLLDELNQSFATKEPLRIGAGGGIAGRFRGAIDDVRIYADVLEWNDVDIIATPQSIDEIVAGSIFTRSGRPGPLYKVQEYYLWHAAPAQWQAAQREFRAAMRDRRAFEEKLPTVMVMQEMATPRATHVLVRGQYDKPGELVEAEVPAELPRLPDGTARNRLALAKWLVDPANPLTSRVTVNRVWQMHFGTGIVKTSEDFGLQGEWPSHPELLDWLAAEFMRDWDVKRMQRGIVTSRTFRQSSAISDLGLGIGDLAVAGISKSQIPNPKLGDPENRLLSRGPRLRLSAEMVRDQALFASGLLVDQVGGKSVKPLQPEGLWSELTGGDDYQAGEGAELVRRSLYTFWKRTIPPPSLATFDASSRETCVVRESRTNTPLQALVLMNEPTLVMAARALAERVMREADEPQERIERAMLHVVGRKPTSDELEVLIRAVARYRERGSEHEVAAYALVCSTILNLDEAVTNQ